MSWLESPAAILLLLLPNFFLGTMGNQQPFPPRLINTALKFLLIKPQIGFLLCLFFISANGNV